MFQKRLDFLQAKEWFFWCFLTPCILGTFCRFIPCNLSRLRVVPVLCDENIHYGICKMMYGEKTTGWNVRLFLRSHPILYGFWHAYKFCVTQTFRSFRPIVTFFCKGLLRIGDTVPCFPKLITMEMTVGALLLGMGPHIRRLNRECHSLGLARPVNRRGRLHYAVCKAMQVVLTQYCPMLLYLGLSLDSAIGPGRRPTRVFLLLRDCRSLCVC